MRIAILARGRQFVKDAEELSCQLGIEIITEDLRNNFDAVISFQQNGMAIQECDGKAAGPVYVDFVGGKSAHRRKYGGGKSQMIAKAVGLQSLKNPYVIDATAGFGRDAFVLASLGCQVQMIERSPIIFALLEDGLRRAAGDSEVAQIINNIEAINCDSTLFINRMNDTPDVIYLDPMFPEKRNSAAAQKEMQMLKKIVGEDQDACQLLNVAMEKVKYRVVVKRPRLAPALSDIKPTFSLNGKSSRFDVYVSLQKGTSCQKP